MVFRRLLSCLLFGFSSCFPLQTTAESLHIAVASNFKQTHLELVDLFHQYRSNQSLPEISILSSTGSSGTLFAQIINGAPYDVFLSADSVRPDKLIALGLAIKQSRQIYAQGQIILWQPKARDKVSINTLIMSSTRYVLANPDLAPYGASAKAIMQSYGAWREQDPSRITAHNIATAFQYLASNTVPIGWVAMSQLHAWQQKYSMGRQSYWQPETSEYPPILQVAVIVSRSENQALAANFLAFLAAPEASSLIRSHGYLRSE